MPSSAKASRSSRSATPSVRRSARVRPSSRAVRSLPAPNRVPEGAMREPYVLSALAHEDREEIFCHIAEDAIDAALRVDRELEKVLLRLAAHPRIGHRRRHLLADTLSCRVGPYHESAVI